MQTSPFTRSNIIIIIGIRDPKQKPNGKQTKDDIFASGPRATEAPSTPLGPRRHTGTGDTSDSVPNFPRIHRNPLPENPNRPTSLPDAQQFRHKYRLIEGGRERTRRSSARRNEAKPFVSFRLRQGGSFLRRKKVTEPPLRHSLPSPHSRPDP